jgi:hypothetical protein
MTDRREETRRALRLRRAGDRSEQAAAAARTARRAAAVLARLQHAFARAECRALMDAHGIAAVPAFIVSCNDTDGGERNSVLEFTVAWRFLYPLLGRPPFAAGFEAACPGLIAELKDTFIAIACEGAFPAGLSAHAGRTHAAKYAPSKLRINRIAAGPGDAI